ncbi:zinc-binding alcohol dehydrogenase family protein [Granulicella sp. dw_53]|uniref:zinc-dependent alcohol dehydrogenase family protein n=1 Tax=Granulicella sp. dw_53 TaxID=2719792 RepID=UPI001BD4BA72
MRAALLRKPRPLTEDPLTIEGVPMPVPAPGEALLKVRACGVCRTDLHIAVGELPQKQETLIPGHQIVAEVVESPSADLPIGTRVGVSWIGGTDGTCPYCRTNRENLCDAPTFTGYTHNGGFAEYTTARTDFLLPLPPGLNDVLAAPLLCAGIIGFRSLRVAEVRPGQRVGLFGFGSSAQLMIRVLQAWDCRVYVSTRGASHQKIARDLGAEWVGEATDVPPDQLDSAITFAPAGDVVIAALRSIAKGGIVAINAIHLDRIPEFDYDTLLWEERQLRSVANMTRQDGRDFLSVAAEINLTPAVQTFRLDQVNQAMQAIAADKTDSSAVVLP